MCVNVPNDVRLGDENMVRRVGMELHVDIIGLRRKPQEMNLLNLVVELWDYSHPFRDFVFSILSADFETKFLPVKRKC